MYNRLLRECQARGFRTIAEMLEAHQHLSTRELADLLGFRARTIRLARQRARTLPAPPA
jgi:hypothetical protein